MAINSNLVLRAIRKNCPKSGSSVTLEDGLTVSTKIAPKSLSTAGYAAAIDEGGGGGVKYTQGKKHRVSGRFDTGEQYKKFLTDIKEDSGSDPALTNRGANTTA